MGRKLHRLTIDAAVTEIKRETQWNSQEDRDEFTAVTLRGEGLPWLAMRWPDDCDDPQLGNKFTVTIEEVP
jgi:hypothetical protein